MVDDLKDSGSERPAIVRIARREVEHQVQKAFGPALLAEDYIWQSVLQPLSVLTSNLCRIRKPIQDVCRKFSNDLDRMSLELDRLMRAYDELDPQIRNLEMRAMEKGWSQEEFDLNLARMVQRRFAKLNLSHGTGADSQVHLHGFSQTRLRAFSRVCYLFTDLSVGKLPNITAEDFRVLLTDLNAPRRGQRSRSEFAKDVLSLARSAEGQGRHLTDGQLAIELFGRNYGDEAIEQRYPELGELLHDFLPWDEGGRKRAIRRRISQIRRSI